MELSNSQILPVQQQIAWAALNDIEVLRECIPGCESLTPVADSEFEVVVVSAIGPVKAKFKGKLQLLNVVPPTSYEIHFEGAGGSAGHGKGTASVRLEPGEPGTTVLHYAANARVGGKIAQIGSRLVDMAAQKMAGDFFQKFNAALAARYPSQERAATTAPGTSVSDGLSLLARVVLWFRKQFGMAS